VDTAATWNRLRDLARLAREQMSLSASALARRAGVEPSTVTRFEAGETNPIGAVLQRLYRELRPGLIELGRDGEFVAVADRVGRPLGPDRDATDPEPHEDLRLSYLVEQMRDLRSDDVLNGRLAIADARGRLAHPVAVGNEGATRTLARYIVMGAASHQEAASVEEYDRGIALAEEGERLARRIGDAYLRDLARWYKAVLSRKRADVGDVRERASAFRLASKLSDATASPAIRAVACAEAAKYWMEVGHPQECRKWIERGEEAATAAVSGASAVDRAEASWLPAFPEHAWAVIFDAKLQWYARGRAGLRAIHQVFGQATKHPQGLSLNIERITLVLVKAEAKFRSGADPDRQKAVVEWAGAYGYADRTGQAKQVLKGIRVIQDEEIQRNLPPAIAMPCHHCGSEISMLVRDDRVYRCVTCRRVTVDLASRVRRRFSA
jgi:transcriptional regulator with XRE-family HTH domain